MVIRNWQEVIPSVIWGGALEWMIMARVGSVGVADQRCCLRSHDRIARIWMQPGLTCRAHVDSQEERLAYVVGGTGVIWINDRSWKIEDGSAIYMPPGADYQVANAGSMPLEAILIVARVGGCSDARGTACCTTAAGGTDHARVAAQASVRNWRDTVPWMEPETHGAGIDWRLMARRNDVCEVTLSAGATRLLPVAIGANQGDQCLQTIKFFSFAMLQPGRSYMPHGHSHEELYYIVKGKGKIQGITAEETEDFPIREGDAILTPVGEKHQLVNDGDSFIEFIAWAADPTE